MDALSLCLRRVRPAVAIAAALLLTGASRADISFVNMFRSDSFLQTGDGNSLSSLGSFFSTSLTSSNPGDFTSVQMTYPGPGSPVNLTPQSSTVFLYQTPTLPNQSTMDASYPTGTYTFDASGAATGSTSFSYTGDDYPQSLPYLTGSDYSKLQGMNSGANFNFHFSSYIPGSQANDSYIFLTILDDTTNSFVYNNGFLPASTTGVTLAANTLLPAHSYTYELIFSNRDLVSSPGADFDAQIGYDLRTQGHFTTASAAPEPGSLALLLPIAGFWGITRRRCR